MDKEQKKKDLGKFYLNCVKTEKDNEKAIEHLIKAAENGNDEAQKILSSFYAQGMYVEQSFEKAYEWQSKYLEQVERELESAWETVDDIERKQFKGD